VPHLHSFPIRQPFSLLKTSSVCRRRQREVPIDHGAKVPHRFESRLFQEESSNDLRLLEDKSLTLGAVLLKERNNLLREK
jgi:hypothetical protein